MRFEELEALFAEHFLKIRDGNHRDNSMNRISASGDPACKIYLRRTGAPSVPSTAAQQYTFEVGHAWHEFFQRLANDMGLSWCEPDGRGGWRGLAEIEVTNHDVGAMGHFDLLTGPLGRNGDGKLQPGVGSGCWVVDFKTMSNIPKLYREVRARKPFRQADGTVSSLYWKRVRVLDGEPFITGEATKLEPGEWDAISSMKEEHRLQASEYGHIINTWGLPEEAWPKHLDWPVERRDGRVWPQVKGVILIYCAKDKGMLDWPDPSDPMNVPVKCFWELMDDALLEELHAKFQSVNECVERGEMPPRLVDPEGGDYPFFPCTFCEFRHACLPDHFDARGRANKSRRRSKT